MKTGIFQDLHANLPALEKAIEVFRKNDCELIFHVGDLIGIGPYPKECLDLALSIEEMQFVMGNHDYWYPFGLPVEMVGEEKEHQEWTHSQIGDGHKKEVGNWPFIKEVMLSNKSISFQHYGFDKKTNWFKDHIECPDALDLNEMFQEVKSEIVFYGHNHIESDLKGNARFVNLGSAGCYTKAEVRLGILDILNDDLQLTKLSVPYNDHYFIEAFELRKVPAREFILKKFISR
jgi:putative phosphoesterase